MIAVVLLALVAAAIAGPALRRDLHRADARRRAREAAAARAASPWGRLASAAAQVGRRLSAISWYFRAGVYLQSQDDMLPPAPVPHRWWSRANPDPCLCPACHR